jgi:alkylation response protein AidB-like acyl-CoA dehydrogenase
MKYGSDEQKAEFLPRILRGEVHFAIGYSEPSAGTDLAALRTRAVRDGDSYIINGSKVFTSLAEFSDYIWLAARTDPNAKKHHGISMFMVDTKSPGYRCTPIWTVGGIRTNATYYDDVRVPASMRVGPENAGWSLIVNQLNHERISLVATGPTERLFEGVRQWAQTTRLPDGRRVIDQEWVRLKLARVRAKLAVLKLLNWRQAWCMTHDSLNFADASAVKVYGTEFGVDAYRDLLEVLGQRGFIKRGSPETVLRGRLEKMHRAALVLTFGGGTNEIQRDIIAMAGLGMPRDLR